MRLIFVDLETGGLDSSRHPITQIAAIAVDEQLNELAAFERKLIFDPAVADPDALNLSCYDRDIWEQAAVPGKHALCDLSRFFKQYADLRMVSQRTGNPYLIAQLAGYNAAAFDGPFLQTFYRGHNEFMPAGYRVLDVMQRVLWHFHERPLMPQPADYKLASVCQYFGVPLEGAHDALADVRATVGLYRALCQEVAWQSGAGQSGAGQSGAGCQSGGAGQSVAGAAGI